MLEGKFMNDFNINILYFLFMGLLPSIEPRYSVPTCILTNNSSLACVVIGIIDIILLSIVLAYATNLLDSILQRLPILSYAYKRYLNRVRKQAIKLKHVSITMLTIFVAAPFPGTGIWTGAFLAYLLGLKRKDILIVLLAGGLLSLTITTAPTLTVIYTIKNKFT
ncbi:MAG TPA: ligand-binding protein SH3 [Pyrodictiaceae archaeon]|nr:ligand-binding protein SH3 [Pyrodictiaceae archaeon]HIQ11228.1 ligand-binding protein SH3 [Pyrodictium sp.]